MYVITRARIPASPTAVSGGIGGEQSIGPVPVCAEGQDTLDLGDAVLRVTEGEVTLRQIELWERILRVARHHRGQQLAGVREPAEVDQRSRPLHLRVLPGPAHISFRFLR
jgi:hypothetical protein